MKINTFGMLAGGLLLSLCMGTGNAQADDLATRRAVENVLREHPELVLDILRNHSEAVLDIAQQGSNARRKRNLQAQWKQDTLTPKIVKLEGRPIMGNKDAKVRIVAFSDFTCHYCQLASSTVDSLLKTYGKDVSLVFKNLPLEEKGTSMEASKYFVAIAMQDEEKAWSFYKRMYASPDRLIAEKEAFIKATAQDLGLDMRKLANDVRSRKVQEIIKEDAADAEKLKVEGTPFFLVNNLVVRGALPLDLFTEAIEMAKKEAN